jgi:hypothetical protein
MNMSNKKLFEAKISMIYHKERIGVYAREVHSFPEGKNKELAKKQLFLSRQSYWHYRRQYERWAA